jgi:hypothetical protein
MKSNLTGRATSAKSSSRAISGVQQQPDSKQKPQPLDQNSKILFSNSLHYKIVKEEESKDLEKRVRKESIS